MSHDELKRRCAEQRAKEMSEPSTESLPLSRLEEWCKDLKKAADKHYTGDLADLRQETHAVCDSILRYARMCVTHQSTNRWSAFTTEDLEQFISPDMQSIEWWDVVEKEIEAELSRRAGCRERNHDRSR